MTTMPKIRTTELNLRSEIHLVLAYEDFEAGKRAQRACQQLAQLASPDTAVNPDSWKFDLLRLPAMRTMAARSAGESDLVVLALHDGETLPSFVLEWIRLTLRSTARRPKALMLLMGPAPEESESLSATKHPLNELVTRSGILCWRLQPEVRNGAWEEPSYAPEDLEPVVRAIRSSRRASQERSRRRPTGALTVNPADRWCRPRPRPSQ